MDTGKVLWFLDEVRVPLKVSSGPWLVLGAREDVLGVLGGLHGSLKKF